MSCWTLSFHFRPREGVCDTPLHLFGCFLGFIGLRIGSVFAHMRAYAIRPYSCSFNIMVEYGLYLHLFGCFLGFVGLRVGSIFAHVRAYAIRPYSCSVDFGIDWGMGRFRFRPREGVCDTPLHLFD